jgi:hypothetical protein
MSEHLRRCSMRSLQLSWSPGKETRAVVSRTDVSGGASLNRLVGPTMFADGVSGATDCSSESSVARPTEAGNTLRGRLLGRFGLRAGESVTETGRATADGGRSASPDGPSRILSGEKEVTGPRDNVSSMSFPATSWSMMTPELTPWARASRRIVE